MKRLPRQLSQKIAMIGVKPDFPSGHKKVVGLVNLISMATGVISLPYIGIYYWAGSPLLSQLVTPFALGCFMTPVLSHFGFTNLSRIVFILVGNCAVTTFSLAMGKNSGIYICYLNLIIYPFLAFEPQERKHLAFGLLLPILSFVILFWRYFNNSPWVILDPSTSDVITFCAMISTFLTLTSAFTFFSIMNRTAESKLESSLSKLQSIFDNVSDTICLIDKEFRFNFINNSVSQYGVDQKYLIGKTIFELLPKDEAEFYASQYQEVFESGKPKKIAHKFTTTRGQKKWHSLVLSPILTSKEITKEIVAISRDMTIEHEILEKLQIAKSKAEEANRTKDEFLAMLSHELRTPLTTILSWVQILRMGKLDSEKTKRGIEILEKSAKSQGQLINDLLDISRIQAGKVSLDFQEIDPEDIIIATLDSVRSLAEDKEIQITWENRNSTKRFPADPVRLQQIFWNLLTNAIKFTQKGGRIRITLDCIKVSTGEKLRIQFCDNGIGIKPEFLPFVFKRFSQADHSNTRAYGGLGLGLAIVRSLVEMHGGSVQAESKGTSQGATFIVELPIHSPYAHIPNDKTSLNLTEPLVETQVRLDGLRLLTIDDNDDTREVISILLQSHGAEVRSAQSVAEGLEILESLKPDVVLCDIAMPGEDGYSFIRKLRASKNDMNLRTPSLAVTAFAGAEDIHTIRNSGFCAHIAKPIDAKELIGVVAQLAKADKKTK